MVPIPSKDVLYELLKSFTSILSPLTVHNPFFFNISAFVLPEKNANVSVSSFKCHKFYRPVTCSWWFSSSQKHLLELPKSVKSVLMMIGSSGPLPCQGDWEGECNGEV